ncbi:MAG: adenylyl-sulfate kinase [Propionibacteriaceae bacterium]
MAEPMWASGTEPRAILINGTVGAGKTSTADAVGELLTTAGVPHAVLDVDALRQAWPAPVNDPFHGELTLANLAAVARNFVAAGSRRLVLAGVIETKEDRVRYQAAVGMPLTVVRLRVALPVIRERLRLRHLDAPGARDWHLARLPELHAILETADIDDSVVEATGRSRLEVAAAVLQVSAAPG